MKKVIKMIIILFLLIFILIAVYILRNLFIINNLRKKFLDTVNENNYYLQKEISMGDTFIIFDMYKMLDKARLTERRFLLNEFLQIKQNTFFDKEITTYVDYGEGEQIIENSVIQEITVLNPYNLYTFKSDSNILVELFNTTIHSVTYNDRNCYLISNSMISNMYIDKENGLVLKCNNGIVEKNNRTYQIEEKYYYEFNNVVEEQVGLNN